MIKVTNLSKAFGALRAVHELSFEAAPRRITSIIGPNGAGKSTAFNLIAGTLRPDAGRVELDGQDVTGAPSYKLARLGVARSFQITNLFFGLSVLENVRLACQSRARRARYLVRLDRLTEPAARAAELLEEFALAERADERVGNLSHGDQRRVEIAVAMALAPKLLMLDEPTQGLSVEETGQAVEVLSGLLAEGNMSVLLVEHDMEVVFRLAQRITVLHRGAVIADGLPDEVRLDAVVQTAYLGGFA